ncbi:MAG: hypothetical protein VX899_11575 [Myxococcota bacterium]|nr:hypothetical protein [Myxococcota bacterium]
MRNRLWAVLGFSLGLIGLNGYLLHQEEEVYFSHMAAQDKEAEVLLSRATDPLGDRYQTDKTQREEDFKAWGLDETQVAMTMKTLRGIDGQHQKRISAWFTNPSEPDDLREYLCGDGGKKPRYWGMALLVVTDSSGERRRVLDPGRTSELEEQEWSVRAPIDRVYSQVELDLERKDDATRMGVAAIMGGHENLVLERTKPFGSGLVGGWSWSGAMALSAGLEDRVLTYFALLHLVLEEAWSEGGFCHQ